MDEIHRLDSFFLSCHVYLRRRFYDFSFVATRKKVLLKAFHVDLLFPRFDDRLSTARYTYRRNILITTGWKKSFLAEETKKF